MHTTWWVAGVALGLLAVGAGAWAFAAPGSSDDDPSPTTTTSTGATRGCPVDQFICDFAKQAEYELREGNPRRLISPKSWYANDSAAGSAGPLTTFLLNPPGAVTEPRVFSIGCPDMGNGQPDCSGYFALVFTTRAEGDELGGGMIGDRELLSFQRDGNELPILTGRAGVPSFPELVRGGYFGRCYAAEDVPSGCVGTIFRPYTTEPAVAVTPTPAAPPLSADDPFDGAEVTDLVAGTQASIGYDAIVYHSTDSGILSRTYRSSDGELRTENLFRPLMELTGGFVFAFAADWDRGHLVVKVCATGDCGGENDPSPDATVRVFRSRDGGVSYTELDASGLPVWSYFRGLVGDDVVVVGMERRGVDYVTPYLLFPSMTPLTPPASVGRAEPQADPEIGIGWLDFVNGSGYYDSSGKLLIPGHAGKRLNFVVPLAYGHRIAQWSSSSAPFQEYVGLYDGLGRLVRVLRSRQHATAFGQLPSGLLFGRVALPEPFAFEVEDGAPACNATIEGAYSSLVNWNAGTVHPILEFGGCVQSPLERYLVHIQSRIVLRVSTGGDCLNVRREPTTTSESLGCFADGVLLGVRGDGPPPVVPGWRAVVTPGGEPGWASSQFLVQ